MINAQEAVEPFLPFWTGALMGWTSQRSRRRLDQGVNHEVGK